MLSEEIKNIIDSFERAKQEHQQAHDEVNKLDKETQDILHSIELDSLTTSERNRLATRLRKVRISRRENKNLVELNEPVAAFLDSDRGRQLLNLLREVLGKTLKIEKYHATRVYHKRVPEGANDENQRIS